MKKILVCTMVTFAFFSCFSMHGGCYSYSPEYASKFQQTREFSDGKALEQMVGKLEKTADEINPVNMSGIDGLMTSFIADIRELQTRDPSGSVVLTNMFSGIIFRLKKLYDASSVRFIGAVNGITTQATRDALKQKLQSIGINVP